MVNGIVSLIYLSIFSLLVYRNARDFCVSILCPATLLYSLISSSNFLVESLGFCYVEDHVICKQWEFYFFFFPIWISFSFSALIAVAQTSKTMLNNSGESEHLCLVPDFRGNAFNFSPLRIMFAMGLDHFLTPHTKINSKFFKKNWCDSIFKQPWNFHMLLLKNIDYLNRCRESLWQNSTSIYDKSPPESRHRSEEHTSELQSR